MPTIAIVGRPNAGKSTLFNRLIGERRAIESDTPGTTRDRVFGTITGEKMDFFLVDTGGLTTDMQNDIEENMRAQAEESIAGADLIYFCIDVREPLTTEEHQIVEIFRKRKPKHVPVFVVGTKAEKPNATEAIGDFYSLGIGDGMFLISAKERMGLEDLIKSSEENFIDRGFEKNDPKKEKNIVAKIAILGRPNAGKSTFTNVLTGKETSIVSPISGTTRDNIDTEVRFEKENYIIIDTAGIRKKSAMYKENIEKFSRLRALSALSRTDIAVLLIDATEGISHQDQVIAGEMREAGVGVVIVFSKWDLIRAEIRDSVEQESQEQKERKGIEMTKDEIDTEVSKRSVNIRSRFLASAQDKFPFLSWAPTLFLSSVEKRGIQEIFYTSKKIMEERYKRIETSEFNNFLEEILHKHPPASRGTKRLKVKFASQVEEAPPKFVFFANDPDAAHFSFARYLENRIRETFGFWGTPIRIEIRRK